MATYAIGDIQGCYHELRLLLNKINFNPNCDQLWLAGDLVSRGPKSLEVMQCLYDIQDSCVAVLGNHDLHLLATYYHHGKVSKRDKLEPLLKSNEAESMMQWLLTQPMAHYDSDFNLLMSHAGVPPAWDLAQTLASAYELEMVLTNAKKRQKYFKKMYGNEPHDWHDNLKKIDRLRFTTNALTRMRFCHTDGSLDLRSKGAPSSQASDLIPWYRFQKKLLQQTGLVFGHWAALNGKVKTENLYALDTGCVWGNKLTALRLEDKKRFSVKAHRKWA
ncbi:MAG: symmetrical bis(5'-nucleosyl)-tetraphosphatase [Gammaproteobacteria bacterium]|nr:symmetrical bis(5'-nucleosyl)-tetraphosphatase [Gammaproteobacteria bacterium]